jgi:uncharacterized protein YeaO (DUF488 family)
LAFEAGKILGDPTASRASPELAMKREPPGIRLKRAYDPPAKTDGRRVLVDRVWPRGVSKDELRFDDWLKQVAPSTELRQWFNHDPAKWNAFKQFYFRELDERPEALELLLAKCREGTVTLVFGAKDTRYNNAVALKDYLERPDKE